MAGVLLRSVEWLVKFVREVDRGIAVGYGYEPPGKESTDKMPRLESPSGLESAMPRVGQGKLRPPVRLSFVSACDANGT